VREVSERGERPEWLKKKPRVSKSDSANRERRERGTDKGIGKRKRRERRAEE
jgi:hypothetical protein